MTHAAPKAREAPLLPQTEPLRPGWAGRGRNSRPATPPTPGLTPSVLRDLGVEVEVEVLQQHMWRTSLARTQFPSLGSGHSSRPSL